MNFNGEQFMQAPYYSEVLAMKIITTGAIICDIRTAIDHKAVKRVLGTISKELELFVVVGVGADSVKIKVSKKAISEAAKNVTRTTFYFYSGFAVKVTFEVD